VKLIDSWTHYIIQKTRSNIVTGIITRLPVGQPNNCGSSPDRSERFFPPSRSPDWL